MKSLLILAYIFVAQISDPDLVISLTVVHAGSATKDAMLRIAGGKASETDFLAVGETLLSQNKGVEALNVFQQATQSFPNSIASRLGYAKSLMNVNRTNEALPIIGAVLKGDPENPDALYLLAKSQLDKGEFKNASDTATKAIRKRADSPILTLRALSLFEQSLWQECVDDINTALVKGCIDNGFDSPATLFLMRACCYRNLGNLKSALADFRMSIWIKKDHPDGWYGIWEVAYLAEEFDLAAGLSREMRSKFPSLKSDHSWIATLEKLQKWDEVTDFCIALRGTGRSSIFSELAIAKSLLYLGRH